MSEDAPIDEGLSPSTPSAEECAEFRKFEYQYVRGEIESYVAETRALERYVLIATGAVWTWLAAKGIPGTSPYWWIPVLFALLGGLRSLALLLSIRRAAAYMRLVEGEFRSSSLKGWENYVNNPRDHSLWITGAAFWFLLLLASVAVPSLLHWL